MLSKSLVFSGIFEVGCFGLFVNICFQTWRILCNAAWKCSSVSWEQNLCFWKFMTVKTCLWMQCCQVLWQYFIRSFHSIQICSAAPVNLLCIHLTWNIFWCHLSPLDLYWKVINANCKRISKPSDFTCPFMKIFKPWRKCTVKLLNGANELALECLQIIWWSGRYENKFCKMGSD